MISSGMVTATRPIAFVSRDKQGGVALLIFVVDPRTRRSCMIRPLKRAVRSAPKIVGHSMKSLIVTTRDRDRRQAVQSLNGQRRSISASPCPPPPHSAATPIPASRRRSSRATCRTGLAPDMPRGCPRAIAPPWTFSGSSSIFSACADASATAARASLISVAFPASLAGRVVRPHGR